MIKSMGRLNIDDYKIMDAHVDKIFKNLDKGKNSLATKQILEMANTANYFVREELGKRLATYPGKGELDSIMAEMLEDLLYGVRATALFYFYYKRQDAPEVIIKTLEKTYKSVPWESETICFEMWKRAPEIMREQMSWWADSPDENKRAMAMHGMENIASRNPQYILTFVSRLLDDESEEVQKKISHILTQVARQRPLQCYTNIRRWLTEADEKRVRTIWQTMKKLVNIYGQRSNRDKSQDFINFTQRTITEWKQDSNPKVQQMGHRLSQIINKK
ncbi:MAG TPA: DNA alkylation repair protein [Candidatus Cloacimonadota bacterium]|nr:DNA alkylation repair protein [Candidatus Cloacimonadota bacterium]